jgi:hypothetical protein
MTSLSAPSTFGYRPIYSQTSAIGLLQTFNALDITLNTVTNAGTLTAAQCLAGLVFHAGTGGALTTPTAAQLIAAMPGCMVGTAFIMNVRTTTSGSTSTLTAGTGVTLSGTAATATLNSKAWMVVVTSNLIGSEAVTMYSLGTSVY